MYKSRLKLWIIVLLLVFFVKQISNIKIENIVLDNVDISIQIEEQDDRINEILGKTIGPFNLVSTKENPSIVIQPSNDEIKEGYTKYENAIFSPIVVYFPTKYDYKDSDIFFTMNSCVYVNFENLSNTILNDKTLKDVDITDSKKEGSKKITLNIPSKNSPYYDVVIEQIYIALNDNKIPTENERKTLEKTVNKLLEKSVEYKDMFSSDNFNNDGYNIFIAPEYYLRYGEKFQMPVHSYNGYYFSCYFESNNAIKYDVFAKNDVFLRETSMAEYVEKYIVNNKNFVKNYFFRTTNDFKYNDYFDCNNPEKITFAK